MNEENNWLQEVSSFPPTHPGEKHQQRKNPKKICSPNAMRVRIAGLVVLAILIFLGLYLISETVDKAAESARDAYASAKDRAAEDAYNKFYDTAFASAERKYHVSNNIAIEVASVREEANLEVLRVSDVEYVIVPKEDNKDGIETWVEFYGDGVYTVDMRASEFIIDSDRQYVLVRVPKPELTNCKITQTKQQFWKDEGFNESNADGTELAMKTRNEGYTKLNNYMKSNAQFYKSAKSSAQTVISDLIKGLNSELTDLIVEVEFMD